MFYNNWVEKIKKLNDTDKKEEILWIKKRIKNLKRQEIRAIKKFDNKKAVYIRREIEELKDILQNIK